VLKYEYIIKPFEIETDELENVKTLSDAICYTT
jgi:hypothetical protein